MIVLGITDSYTCGATIVVDGQVIAAVSEERLIRKKMAVGFPRESILMVLAMAGIELKDVDHVVVATNHLFWKAKAEKLEDYFRTSKGRGRDLFLRVGSMFSNLTQGSHLSRKVYQECKKVLTQSRKSHIREIFSGEFGYEGPVTFLDHHLAHCASAYFTSGMKDATVMSLDGAGDGCSSHVYQFREGAFRLLHKVDSYDSIGNYYAYVTHLCGFQAHKHEGKITGLAAYGNTRYVDILNNFIRYESGDIKNLGACFDRSAIRKLEDVLGENFSHEDLACSIQYHLEDVATQFIDHWVRASGISDIALAGGVVANVKLNQRIHNLENVRSLFIHPGMGDEGLATGAALFKCYQLCQKTETPFQFQSIEHVYWGPEFSDKEIEAELHTSGLPFRKYQNVEREVAKILAKSKVVARFNGAMEYGPRALGNRSILYQPGDVSVNAWLNKKLNRTEFMPFAPVTLKEHADECYEAMDGARQAAKFMTITFDCTSSMKKSSPAVVHVDGTARPQIIERTTNASYYDIVDEYYKITGIPSVVNTSFNMHEEPIVCTPSDAVRAFHQGNLDYLAIGNFLVTNAPTSNPLPSS